MGREEPAALISVGLQVVCLLLAVGLVRRAGEQHCVVLHERRQAPDEGGAAGRRRHQVVPVVVVEVHPASASGRGHLRRVDELRQGALERVDGTGDERHLRQVALAAAPGEREVGGQTSVTARLHHRHGELPAPLPRLDDDGHVRSTRHRAEHEGAVGVRLRLHEGTAEELFAAAGAARTIGERRHRRIGDVDGHVRQRVRVHRRRSHHPTQHSRRRAPVTDVLPAGEVHAASVGDRSTAARAARGRRASRAAA